MYKLNSYFCCMENIFTDEYFMKKALQEAETAFEKDEIPVGAIIVIDNKVIARSHNLTELLNDVTAHAEMQSITAAANFLGGKYLKDCTLYVTLEPCPMCLSAMVQSRLKQCIFGAYDSKGGALSLGYFLHQDKRLNHQFSVFGGVRHFECSRLLSQFFKERRTNYKPKN